MKVCILAGGMGTRLSEETSLRPKPMVEIGHQPILWHIMKRFAGFGFKDFVVALGYKGDVIKDYFVNYGHRYAHNLSVSLASGDVTVHRGIGEDWRVQLVETGAGTETGGRIKRLNPWLGEQTFMMTYGDAVASIDLDALLAFHRAHGKLATVTAVRPSARFGGLTFDGDRVQRFTEKPQIGEGWVNGGFFVLEPGVADYIDGDDVPFEREPLERLAKAGQLMAYRHEGFWQCVDTLRELQLLRKLWSDNAAPWKLADGD